MQPNPGRLYAQALKLPSAARAALAGRLISSLEATVDEDAERTWAEELERRIAALDAGEVRAVPWTLARRRILRLAGARRQR